MTTDRRLALALGASIAVAACGVGPTIEVERSLASTGDLVADRDVVIASSPATPRPADEPSLPPEPSSESAIAWASCVGYGIPSDAELGTSGWECARLTVAMDPSGDTSPTDTGDVVLALTRHRATGERMGSLLMNPGGPGGAGLPLAWNLRSGLPPDVLRSFDVIGWDPRGIGQSLPAAVCPDALTPDDFGYIAGCVDETGPLSGFLAAPYSVADMEAIRVALGDQRLNYLGYSYGSILGALYAERYPDRTGAFVLDGVTDPDVGSPDGPFSNGFATFADDGLPAALDRFYELCGASDLCLGPGAGDPESEIDAIAGTAAELTTEDHAGTPEVISPLMVNDHVRWSMSSAAEWELLGAALSDARDSLGSTLAAHIETTGLVPSTKEPEDGGSDDGSAPDNFEVANFMIYCADLGPLIDEWAFCDAMPAADDPLTPIAAVSVERPVLVIGTEYDPLTPGYHAPDFADRLGDAVWMIWDGVGHTAFPGWTRCIDDAVADHLLGGSLIESGLRCPFIDGIETDEELAEGLFGFDLRDGRSWLRGSLELSGRVAPDRVECVSAQIVPDVDPDHEVVAELILEVTSTEAVAALDAALAVC